MPDMNTTMTLSTGDVARILALVSKRLEALAYEEDEPKDETELSDLEALERRLLSAPFD